MKKVFGQTVRDIKREVNKKVLKVPGIEQKVLDATSNEPWGPHGTLLADIAQASRNYHEYQMIMSVLWKRISDTGKNWRHVYKGLTVLEYLVAHGSERVIDDIREHAYQISTLSGFQYIDSSGRDQGNNVRKKSQSLMALVNDKEMIVEVRQKAAVNREKFRTSSTSGMYQSSSRGDRYDDDRYEDRYGSRNDDKNGYGREREWGSRDDGCYNRNGDTYNHDGDRYGRDYEGRYGRDGYKDGDYRGSNLNTDEYQHGSRSRSSDRDRDRAYDNDAPYSSPGSGARVDDQSLNGRGHEQNLSEQNTGAPPSYEEAVTKSQSPVHSERDGETASSSAARASPCVENNPSHGATTFNNDASSVKQGVEPSDEFDPRGFVVAPVSAPPATSSSLEMDLLGSLSDSYSSNVLAIMPATSTTSSGTDAHANLGSGPTYAAPPPSSSNVSNQVFEDPFGDAPFKAIPSTDSGLPQPQPSTSAAHFQPTMNQHAEHPQPGTNNAEAGTNLGFGDSFSATTYPASSAPGAQPPNSQFMSQEPSVLQQDIDILADILPPSGPQPLVVSQAPFSSSTGHPAQPNTNVYGGYLPHAGFVAPVAPNMPSQFQAGAMQPPQTQNLAGAQLGSGNFYSVGGSTSPQYPTGSAAQFSSGNFLQQQGSPVGSQSGFHMISGPAVQHNGDMLGNLLPQAGPKNQMASQPMLPLSTGSSSIVSQPSKDKFETKSTVWADTMSRGLVDLNISGSKTNPLADIGIDFEAINRKERRMEKPAASPVTSSITMGKAMGSGSGMGRAGATALRPVSNPMMGSAMGMGMGGGYGGMSQPMGMGMGMNMGMGMGMNMNMRMGQGVPMQPPTGLPPGSAMPSGYNPMMGRGGYAPQQPYGGSYR